MDYKKERDTLRDAIHANHKLGLIYLKSGNLSIRTPDNNVLIKPSGCNYENVTSENLSLVDINGKQIGGELPPSSETPMHTMIYRAFPKINAIVHTHSTYALICAITNTEVPVFCNEGTGIGGRLRVAEYGAPGTQTIGENAIKALNGTPTVKAALLKNHGAIAIGANMEEACRVAQYVEKLCMIYTKAKALGPITTMTDEQIQEIKDTYLALKKKYAAEKK
jgi:L-fuculose-phosphate aldolase